jgi:hypothetical protein
VLKILAAYDTNAAASLLRFDGPQTIAEPLQSSKAGCACSHA